MGAAKGFLRRARWFVLGGAVGALLAAASVAYATSGRPGHGAGAASLGGASIAQKLRTKSAVTVPPGTPPSVPPVFDPAVSAPWHWTQEAGKIYMMVGGAKVAAPSKCTKSGTPELPELTFYVVIDGQAQGAFDIIAAAGTTKVDNIGEVMLDGNGSHFLYEGSKNVAHTLDFQVESNCAGKGQSWTVDSLGVDVVAIG